MQKIKSIYLNLSQRSFIKNSAVMFLGSVVGNVLAYLYHLIVARRLGPVQYGELGALISIYYIINVPSGIIQNGLTKYFSVLKARNEIGQAKSLYLNSVRLLLMSCLCGLILSILLMNSIANFLNIHEPLNVLLLYVMFATFFVSVPNLSSYSGYQKFTEMSILTNIIAVLRIVFGYLAAPLGVAWSLVASIITNLSGYVLGLFPLRFLLVAQSQKLNISKSRVLKYAVPMSIAFLGVTSLYSVDVVLVKHFFTSYEAGIYSSLSVLGKIIFFASFAITSVIFPTIAERKEKGESFRKLILSGAGIVGLISVLVTIFYFIQPEFTVRLLFGASYDGAIPYIGNFGIFLSFVTLATFLVQCFLAAGKTIVAFYVSVATAAQILLIWTYHNSIMDVIGVNIAVAASLCFILLSLIFSKL